MIFLIYFCCLNLLTICIFAYHGDYTVAPQIIGHIQRIIPDIKFHIICVRFDIV